MNSKENTKLFYQMSSSFSLFSYLWLVSCWYRVSEDALNECKLGWKLIIWVCPVGIPKWTVGSLPDLIIIMNLFLPCNGIFWLLLFLEFFWLVLLSSGALTNLVELFLFRITNDYKNTCSICNVCKLF